MVETILLLVFVLTLVRAFLQLALMRPLLLLPMLMLLLLLLLLPLHRSLRSEVWRRRQPRLMRRPMLKRLALTLERRRASQRDGLPERRHVPERPRTRQRRRSPNHRARLRDPGVLGLLVLRSRAAAALVAVVEELAGSLALQSGDLLPIFLPIFLMIFLTTSSDPATRSLGGVDVRALALLPHARQIVGPAVGREPVRPEREW